MGRKSVNGEDGYLKHLILIICLLVLTNCTFLVTTFEIGGAAATAEGASTAVEVAQALDIAGTAGDAVSVRETGKTLSDHVVSGLTGKDCRLLRKIRGRGDYCEIPLPNLNTRNKIKVFQIVEGIRPVNGKMGPLTRQAYWNYEHEVKAWDSKIYDKLPKTAPEIIRLQQDNGLEAIGEIGPRTTRLLIKLHKEIKDGIDKEAKRSVRNADRGRSQGHDLWGHQRTIKE